MRQKVDEVELLRQRVDELAKEKLGSDAMRIQSELRAAQLERLLSESAQREATLTALVSQLLTASSTASLLFPLAQSSPSSTSPAS